MPLTHICLCMYLEYTCLKWIYHMRSYKYDWLKNIYTCTFISYSYWYTYTFFWFVFIYQKCENKVNQENRFLDFFFLREIEKKRMRISLKYWVSNFPVLWYVIILTDCLFFEDWHEAMHLLYYQIFSWLSHMLHCTYSIHLLTCSKMN